MEDKQQDTDDTVSGLVMLARWLALIAAAIVFTLLTAMVIQGSTSAWDIRAFRFVNGWPEKWSWLFTGVTFFGSGWMVLVAVVAAYILKRYRLSWQMAFATSTVYAAGLIAKELVGRPRPNDLIAGVHLLAGESGFGYPSLHAAIVTAVVLTIVMYGYSKRYWLLLPLIAAVGVSRIYLGVHMPFDVLGGFLLGVIIVVLPRVLPSRVREWLFVERAPSRP